ncbi:fumarylacetoacetate hydrolase family protein [Nocardia camponoti]|uniref:fumarylacetoacetate hydrolase family protein n=1 Tax=Nocardia camponoti TaxID=1616106 RepID=UPI00166F14F5|nr:fumarylacetoacetate hydrolase family protein [Nocardia camponoti]
MDFVPPQSDSRRVAVLASGVTLPGSLIGIGRNYRANGDETARDPARIPLIFGKFANSVIGHDEQIVVPASVTAVCEGELALVVGTRVRSVRTESAALAALAGVCLANDVSIRAWQDADGQSTRGKSVDSFCPLGPEVVALDALPGLAERELTTRVNGKVVQRARIDRMWFSPAELVMFCSEFMTLYPGDLILTGTPDGPDTPIGEGDIVEVTLPGVATLRNPVVEAVSERCPQSEVTVGQAQ